MRSSRRRGTKLEDTLLDAAWAELLDKGYGGLTMEAVAKRAGTSRPVLARRWTSKPALTVAAIAHYMRKNPICVPDLGGVREELLLFLQKISDRSAVTIGRVLFSMHDYFIETNSSLTDLRKAVREQLHAGPVIDDILSRGVARGEIDPALLTDRIAALPLDLVSHEALMTHGPVDCVVIAEIIDQVFLPLVAKSDKART